MNTRAKNLVNAMPEGFEAAIIGTEPNRFYLLDFEAGDAGTLIVLPDKMVYIIDSRYIELAQKEITCAEVVLQDEIMEQIAEVLQKAGVKRVHLEEKASIASWNGLKKKFPEISFDTSAVLSDTLDELRVIKDSEEIARIKKAQEITDACFAHILPFIKEGVREIDLALEMESFIRSHGAEGIAFDTICVSGTKSSLPHGTPGENTVQKGDLLTLDFGAKYKGYCSDMTRTVAIGEPGEEKRRVYATVLKAHLEAAAAAKAGMLGLEVDKVARDVINAAGYEGKFGHGLGHAVGIEIHEQPAFSPRCKKSIPAGSVMTIEPGIYLAGQFGCRIEDMVLMHENGCTPMPSSSKELIVL